MKTKLAIGIALTCLFGYAIYAQTNISGIGVMIRADDHAVKIEQVQPNSPARRANLTRGLLILKIDDTSTEDMNIRTCADKIRGETGTKVRLELLDPLKGETNTVELTREPMTIPTLPAGTK